MQDWQRSVIYQVYPKSFHSHAGNPTGDLLGIVAKLDYLHWLGRLLVDHAIPALAAAR